jgi:rod shape-determining protein MreC
VAGVLRLVGYIGFAVALMVLDRRFAALEGLRAAAAHVAEPVVRLAELPARGAHWLRYVVVEREQLATENQRLKEALLQSRQQATALQVALEQMQRQQQLLDAAPADLGGVLVRVIEVDLGSSRARVLVDRGARHGVRVGDAALDAFGIFGQVVRVGHEQAEVLMLSDPDHAIPVLVSRSGLRAIAQGGGLDAPLRIDSVPLTADIRSGDALVSSGLGGRFPAGFPVGTVLRVSREDGAAFLSVEIEPAARLQASRELLLTHVPVVTPQLLEGPPLPPPAPTTPTPAAPAAPAPTEAR